jgi:hypothetical protein
LYYITLATNEYLVMIILNDLGKVILVKKP